MIRWRSAVGRRVEGSARRAWRPIAVLATLTLMVEVGDWAFSYRTISRLVAQADATHASGWYAEAVPIYTQAVQELASRGRRAEILTPLARCVAGIDDPALAVELALPDSTGPQTSRLASTTTSLWLGAETEAPQGNIQRMREHFVPGVIGQWDVDAFDSHDKRIGTTLRARRRFLVARGLDAD